MEGFLKEADGAVGVLEGMRLLDEDDGVDGSIQECTYDVDLTERALFNDCDADEDAHRGVSSDGRVGEVEIHHVGSFGGGVANNDGGSEDAGTGFVGLFVVEAIVVVEAGYFNNVVVTVVAEADGVLRGVRWW
ncbi:unnamed protein product [Closterium sp. NIES-54]